jgi:hypothetical protein
MQKTSYCKWILSDALESYEATGKMKLSEKKKELLREFVNRKCECCNKSESEVGKLTIHRVKRGSSGGEYILRNVLVCCSNCHHKFHEKEFL